ncbi:MAG: hypothetical protein HC802_08125 [Caldilineaceae bacterium]|nr:hypothetical protein [Caldilineaceae bacterium]
MARVGLLQGAHYNGSIRSEAAWLPEEMKRALGTWPIVGTLIARPMSIDFREESGLVSSE